MASLGFWMPEASYFNGRYSFLETLCLKKIANTYLLYVLLNKLEYFMPKTSNTLI